MHEPESWRGLSLDLRPEGMVCVVVVSEARKVVSAAEASLLSAPTQ